MKNLLKTLARNVGKVLTHEFKGFAGESADGTKASSDNAPEYLHMGTAHQYDQVGGKDDENNTPPPKGLILLPFLYDGQGYDPGDTAPTIGVTLSYSNGGVNDNLGFSVQNESYRDLYDAAFGAGLIVNQNDAGEGEFFTVANGDGVGYITRVSCDSENELIQVTHDLPDSFNQTGCMVLVNKSI